jgi:hypothetical protein
VKRRVLDILEVCEARLALPLKLPDREMLRDLDQLLDAVQSPDIDKSSISDFVILVDI